MRRNLAAPFFGGDQKAAFGGAGRGRGGGFIASEASLPSAAFGGVSSTAPTKAPIYSLTNFAARKQVVPVAKGFGIVASPSGAEERTNRSSPESAKTVQNEIGAKESPKVQCEMKAEATASASASAAHNLLASVRSPSAGGLRPIPVSVARDLLRSERPLSPSEDAAANPRPSASAFKVSGQSLLRSLARRSQNQPHQNHAPPPPSAHQQAKVSHATLESDDCEQPSNADLRYHIEITQALIQGIHERKVVRWDALPESIRHLPAFHRRNAFVRHAANAAVEATSPTNAHGGAHLSNALLPPLLCTGDTGCGKSIIVPLVMMDLHWRGVVIGLTRYLGRLLHLHRLTIEEDMKASTVKARSEGRSSEEGTEEPALSLQIVPDCVRGDADYHDVPQAFVPIFDERKSVEEFLKEFPSLTRLRIYVSQPTRLASKNLAEFMNELLSATVAGPRGLPSSAPKLPLGLRVGYATALDKCVSNETCEIIFATVGYLLNKVASDCQARRRALPSSSSKVEGVVGKMASKIDNLMPPSEGDKGLETASSTEFNVMTQQATPNVFEDVSTAAAAGAGSVAPADANEHDGQRALLASQNASHDALLPFTIILDEAHRRDLQSDLLMTWVREWHTLASKGRRGPLDEKKRLLIMSASIDHDMFARYFYPTETQEGSAQTDQQNNSQVAPKAIGATPFDLGQESPNDYDGDVNEAAVAGRNADPFPSEMRICLSSEEIANEVLSPAPIRTTPRPKVAGSIRKPFTKSVIFGDDLLNASRVARGQSSTSSSSEAANLHMCNTAVSILSRASNAAIDALYHASFYAVDAISNPTEARQLAKAKRESLRVSLVDAAAQVAFQCVAENQNVLMFVAGYDEMVQFTLAIAALANVQPSSVNLSPREDALQNSQSSSMDDGGNGPALSFLQKGVGGANVVVDVVALHSSAIGESSAQLRSSKSKAKIIVATNVAESSITIPDVALVLNTGFERTASNEEGGANRLVSRIASKSSFIQREGRTGRTCDGLVIHLLRRSVYDEQQAHSLPQWQASGEMLQFLMTSKLLFPPKQHHHSIEADDNLPHFSLSTLCEKLPAPILDASQLLPFAAQLCDMGVFSDPETQSENSDVAWSLLNGASLTFKGQFIASLPLPTHMAMLVYHGYMYGCLDAALMTACALEANIVRVFGEASIPRDALEHGLRERFALAAQDNPTTGTDHYVPSDAWLNFKLIERWYATPHGEKKDFAHKYLLSLKSMLRADDNLAMACAKLVDVLHLMDGADDGGRTQHRHIIRRLNDMRKHALANAQVMRSLQRGGNKRRVFHLPTLSPCALHPSENSAVSLYDRLRASFINTFQANIMIGHTSASTEKRFVTSAHRDISLAMERALIAAGSASGVPLPDVIASVKLSAGVRNISQNFLTLVGRHDLNAALGKMFASSSLIRLENAKLLPARSAVMMRMVDTSNVKLKAADDNAQDASIDEAEETSINISTAPLSSSLMANTPAKSGGLSHLLRPAAFPQWLLNTLPLEMREARLPLQAKNSNIDSLANYDADGDMSYFDIFSEHWGESSARTVIPTLEPQSSRARDADPLSFAEKLIRMSGRVVRDEKSGVQTRFELGQSVTAEEEIAGDDLRARGDAPPSLDLLRAAALGFGEWSPSEETFKSAAAFISSEQERRLKQKAEAETPEAVANEAQPWKMNQPVSRIHDMTQLKNIFLTIGRIVVPNAIQWVVHVNPRMVINKITSTHATRIAEHTKTTTRSRNLAVDAEDNEVEKSSDSPASSSSSVENFLDRITCPVCCESIPASEKALHIVKPSHIRNLHRLTTLGTPLDSVSRAIAASQSPTSKEVLTATKSVLLDANAATGEPSILQSLGASPRKLIIEAMTAPSVRRALSIKDGGDHRDNVTRPFVKIRDLIPAEQAKVPMPAAVASRSLNSLLSAPPASNPSLQRSRSTAVAIGFATETEVRGSGFLATPCAWVLNPNYHQDAFLLLQAAVLQGATVSQQSQAPLMLLFDGTHSLVHGFCLVGLYTVSFGDTPLDASVVQQLLEVKHGAARSSALFGGEEGVAASPAGGKLSHKRDSETDAKKNTLRALAISKFALSKLKETLTTGLTPSNAKSASPSHSHSNAERHWCPLQYPCASRQCEQRRAVAAQMKHPQTAHRSAVEWSPENPIEAVVSGAIIALLHEAHLVNRPRQSLTFFTQRLLHNLALASKQMGIGARKRVVTIDVEAVVKPPVVDEGSKKPAKGKGKKKSAKSKECEVVSVQPEMKAVTTVDVEFETGSGIRLLDGFLKLRGAESLEYVLTHCGCVFTTTQRDGAFVAPPILPTAIPSPEVMRIIQEGGN